MKCNKIFRILGVAVLLLFVLCPKRPRCPGFRRRQPDIQHTCFRAWPFTNPAV